MYQTNNNDENESDFLGLDYFRDVLEEVYKQISQGKGKQRHGLFKEFDEQPWKVIADHVGKEFLVGQAVKKLMELRVHEHQILSLKKNPSVPKNDPQLDEIRKKWRTDALGAIVYVVMTVMYSDHQEYLDDI